MQKMLFVIALVVALVALIKLILALKIQRRLGRVAPDIGEFLGRAPDPGERLLRLPSQSTLHSLQTHDPANQRHAHKIQ